MFQAPRHFSRRKGSTVFLSRCEKMPVCGQLLQTGPCLLSARAPADKVVPGRQFCELPHHQEKLTLSLGDSPSQAWGSRGARGDVSSYTVGGQRGWQLTRGG